MPKKKLRDMTEEELSEYELPKVRSIFTLFYIIYQLSRRSHDYGTCVYAMSLSAEAAFRFVAHKLGATGFQASCADMDFLKRTRRMKHGFMIIDYRNLLYPQYLTDEHFPTIKGLEENHREHLAKCAVELMEEAKREGNEIHPDVWARWEALASSY